jgi:hypothetical protein
MRSTLSLAAISLLAAAACTGGARPASLAAAPSPGTTTVPGTATPSGLTSPSGPSTVPGADTYWLRMRTTQAIAPLNQFAVQPVLRITGDGTAVVDGPVPEIYPGPLLPNLLGRQVSEAGRQAIIQAAKDLGLLDGRTEFSGPNLVMGGVTGHMELTVDGRRVELTGDPSAGIECVATPCNPAPGTPEAFGELWRQLMDLPSWIGSELGPEAPYTAPADAILVGPPPDADPALQQAVADWPLAQPLASFGGPVANGTARCGTVSGADADTLRPSLAAANQLTPWVQDPGDTTTFGLTVRPMVPGEDVCREVFGPA